MNFTFKKHSLNIFKKIKFNLNSKISLSFFFQCSLISIYLSKVKFSSKKTKQITLKSKQYKCKIGNIFLYILFSAWKLTLSFFSNKNYILEKDGVFILRSWFYRINCKYGLNIIKKRSLNIFFKHLCIWHAH